ncbi:MAG TPA: hypothetical protein VM533_04670 [Fimbriiglobus sp.]|nr:hypothetical protein [Fimbriiglobus sp.]
MSVVAFFGRYRGYEDGSTVELDRADQLGLGQLRQGPVDDGATNGAAQRRHEVFDGKRAGDRESRINDLRPLFGESLASPCQKLSVTISR